MPAWVILIYLLLVAGCTSYETFDHADTASWIDSRQAHRKDPWNFNRVSVQHDSQRADADGRYIVLPGDTLAGIARRHNTTISYLAGINSLSQPFEIYAGEVLWVKPPPKRPNFYIVKEGDTFFDIAQRYRLSYRLLSGYNPQVNPEVIRPGQRLALKRQAPAQRTLAAAPSAKTVQPSLPVARPADIVTPAQMAASKKTPYLDQKGFAWPVNGELIERFGKNDNGTVSDGISIAAPVGSIVRAAQSGVIAYAGEGVAGAGRIVMIRHDNNFYSTYSHNSLLLVSAGDIVSRDQPIAKVGATGSVSTPRLHFELRLSEKPVNPLKYLGENGTQLASSQ